MCRHSLEDVYKLEVCMWRLPGLSGKGFRDVGSLKDKNRRFKGVHSKSLSEKEREKKEDPVHGQALGH